MYRSFTVFCLLLALCIGCGTKESSQPTVSVPMEESVPLPDVLPSPAAQTVSDFMTAMLRGEDETIRALLTPTARKAGEEQGVPFSPPASDTAAFTIDKTVPSGDSAMLITTTLTDVDPASGQRESAEIVWTVVLTEEGWRISEALVALFEGQPPIRINFEDPEATQKALIDAETKERQKHAQ